MTFEFKSRYSRALEYLPLLLIKKRFLWQLTTANHFRAWISSDGQNIIYVIQLLKKNRVLKAINICFKNYYARIYFMWFPLTIRICPRDRYEYQGISARLYVNFWRVK